jgi:translation initiation factor 1 (eIF-1/SUI1)
MKKILLLSVLLVAGCTYYTEKQSEALSQNVYAANDSLNKARVDLAYYYSDQTTRLVKPPKKRINIQPVYQAGEVIKDAKAGEKTRVVIVPSQYKGDKVVVVDSVEYQDLLKVKAIAEQLKKDNANLTSAKENTDKELAKQAEYNNKMIKDLNHLQAEVYKKDLAILWRNIIIISLIGLIGGYIYLRMNKLFFF